MKNLFFILLLLISQGTLSTRPEEYDINIYTEFSKKIDMKNREECVSQATDLERRFLSGIIRQYKPKKILEIGVAYGCSSAVILNAIKDIEGSFLTSIDLNEICYIDNNLKTGGFVEKATPDLYNMNKWKLITGKYTPEVIEEIGGDIDLVFIDTVHFLAGEALDIPVIIPFMKKNGIIVIH